MRILLAIALLFTAWWAAWPAEAARPRVKLGIEVLLDERPALLKGKRVGLITNMSAIDGRGVSVIDRLAAAPGVRLVALFAPEHGLRADLDVENIPNGKDPRTGAPVFSLYGKHRAPTAEQLANVDVLVFDIQDAGARFYTYSTTLGLCMEAAKQHGKPFVVLDRPNPITGLAEGDMLDGGIRHFTGRYPLTTRHGMTMGELARYIDGEEGLGAALTVVPMAGWRRAMYYDETGLPWRRPSPAMLSPDTALYYVGVGMFEATNVNCRAPGKPFRWVGAKWADAGTLAAEMSALKAPGVSFAPAVVKDMGGVDVRITNRWAFKPVETAARMMGVFARLYPDKFEPYRSGLGIMSGSDELWETLTRRGDLGPVVSRYRKAEAAYETRRKRYLLYP